jgi:predicted nicotinamide N-methyase
VTPDPLRASIEEQLVRMRDGSDLPPALLDVVAETFTAGEREFTVVKPSDWDELRHQEGSGGRTAPYWAIAWPSGQGLAEALAGRDLGGKRVLELGCGLALPSLAAAHAGGEVTATDGSPDAVVFAAHNLALNDLEGEVALGDWREPDALAEGGPWDLVLASDILYLRHNVEALLRALPRLVAPGGTALLADPGRSGCREFLAAARASYSVQSAPDPKRGKVTIYTLRPRAARPT